MAEEEKKAIQEDDKCTHPLLCADDWKDPEGAKVIGEYHKDEDLSEEERRIEADLDEFEKYWQGKHGINFFSEYHKEGAPFLEESSGWDGHRPRLGKPSNGTPDIHQHAGDEPGATAHRVERAKETSSEAVVEVKVEERAAPVPTAPRTRAPPEAGESAGTERPGQQQLKISEVLNINTIEVITYMLFRFAYGKQLHVPIKRENLVDMDLHINNKDVVINTNQLYFSFPELVVWHITYTHKGKPVLEIGRGVKKGMKVHRFNAIRLLIEVWMGNRRAEKLKQLETSGATKQKAVPAPNSRPSEPEDKGDIT